ncbi:hypothetical protein BFR38_06170 [Brochothrix thermosphacta]|nr:hypothetical protein BFR38_06170 [Brochothrix thermosphacta]ODJ54701.1 hypothetical protein BFR42_07215 [Brochothrix thermosphacta]
MKAPSHPFKIEEIGENTILTLFVRMVFLKYHEFWCEVLEKNKNENSPFNGDERMMLHILMVRNRERVVKS